MAVQRTYDKTKLMDSYSEKKNEINDKNHEKATMAYKVMRRCTTSEIKWLKI